MLLCDEPLLSLDLDASRTFYHDVLGLEIAREDEDVALVLGQMIGG